MRFVAMDLVRAFVARTTLNTGLDSTGVVIAQPEDLSALETLKANCDVLDYRTQPRTKTQKRGRPHGRMKLKKTVGIMLHQTAADIADEDRLLNIPSHCAVSDEAHAVLLQPLTAYMYHGHGANSFCLSIEVVCRAAGIEGNMDTVWLSKKEKKRGVQPHQVVREATDAQLETCRHLVRYLHEAVEEAGGEVSVIMAHRQSARKSADPGSRIWKGVGEWARDELGLRIGPVIGKGADLPFAWTGTGTVPYNWKIAGFTDLAA